MGLCTTPVAHLRPVSVSRRFPGCTSAGTTSRRPVCCVRLRLRRSALGAFLLSSGDHVAAATSQFSASFQSACYSAHLRTARPTHYAIVRIYRAGGNKKKTPDSNYGSGVKQPAGLIKLSALPPASPSYRTCLELLRTARNSSRIAPPTRVPSCRRRLCPPMYCAD